MQNELLINVRPYETRVAHIQNGDLIEFKIERHSSPTIVGHIYKGRVMRVLPGMQAAFVDIGMDRAAFLYVGDVRSESSDEAPLLLSEGEEPLAETSEESVEKRTPIQDLLKEGQYVLVQVSKDPLGNKGPRVTTHISLPGRFLVYMPTVKHLGISRRIDDLAERERLEKIIHGLNPKGGVIVRTAGEGATAEQLTTDLTYLTRLAEQVMQKDQQAPGVSLVHGDLSVELRALRDLLTEDITQVVVDDRAAYDRINEFLGEFMPNFKNRLECYTGTGELFNEYDIDLEISRATERKIWLKSGGYIIIDETEALVAIDVNTGSFVGRKDLDETILKTNLEAVKEVCHQLRLRHCGGIIIIDFIDMEKEAHREKVMHLLREELKRDRARTSISEMSSLGLVEMTRKRTSPSLLKVMSESCSYCSGKGFISRPATVAFEIFRQLESQPLVAAKKATVVHCQSEVADWIYQESSETLELIEKRVGHPIILKIEPNYHREQFELT